ncbi:MAG: enoyl-CoA hydratase/isomerase family protein [Theionarchaea archaeon]|nr:enoyl-CoA hydratase/isomerase family protein [Theionarchaea archaeon]
MTHYSTITVEYTDEVAWVTLNRPQVYNAFNDIQVGELTACFSHLSSESGISAIVLTGKGRHFCAGADLNWMKQVASYTKEENRADSHLLGEMYRTIAMSPKPVVGCINGSAFGGGVGLVAACDIAVCSDEAQFAFSEVKLGIVPAVISTYVLPKIGLSHARHLFITGERFPAQKALEIGLIHSLSPPAQLSKRTAEYLSLLKSSGPHAIAAVKELLEQWSTMEKEAFSTYTEELIANLRASEGGTEGIRAFLEKRKPVWR